MDLVREFFRDKTPAQLVMIAAIVLLFVSQFFLYLNDEGSGFIPNALDLEHYTQLVITSYGAVGTGWELHPHAYVIVVVLAFVFLRDDIQSLPLFARFGWWASLLLFFAAISPGAPLRNAIGASMGGIAFLIAIGAVILHHVEVRRAKAATVATPDRPR